MARSGDPLPGPPARSRGQEQHATLSQRVLGLGGGLAVLGGQVVRRWRRHRAAARQDAFVEAWKNAWTEGCHHRWQGGPRDEAPNVTADQRAAWLAGWQWADAHPNRRRDDPPVVRDYRRSTDRRSRLARGTRRGIAGLTLLAVARWWWRRQNVARPGPVSSQERVTSQERASTADQGKRLGNDAFVRRTP